ncbi:MAG TPA: hypothetical protein VGI92_13510 [Gemmatimonadales bacterium]|jgi:hypothetical protein
MHEGTLPLLTDWSTFYVIIGSSGAALTGLMFVAIALVADTSPAREAEQGMGAFGTPTVVHLCAVLIVAAMLCAPWHSLLPAAWAVGMAGGAGVIYMAFVTRRAHRVTIYKPVMEDWIFHTIVPFTAYIMILAGGILLPRNTDSLFSIGGATLLLLFAAIHNAWDTVTYLALQATQRREKERQEPASRQ